MAKLTKNRKESISKFDRDMLYSLEQASKIVKDAIKEYNIDPEKPYPVKL